MMILSMSRSSWSDSRISSSCSSPVRRTPPEQRVGHRARLLVDLLAHEPVVALLLGRRQVPVDVVAPALLRDAVEVGDLDRVAGDRDDLVLAELERLAGVLDERRDVGAEEVLAVAEPDDQRRVAAGRHHPRRVERVDGHQRERAVELHADPLHRLGQVDAGGQLELEQLGGDLGVGLGEQPELVGVGLDPGAQLGEVLDDPVVHQRHPAAEAEVRVRVDVVGRAVGGPAGVPDAGRRRRQRRVGDRLLEVGELAGLLGPARSSRRTTRATPAES